MIQETSLAQTVRQTADHPAYDTACKKFLANKNILAWILQSCVPEFKETSISDIVDKYIEGTPLIASVGVHPDEEAAGSIRGSNTEDATLNEGTVYYDVRFFALVPGNEKEHLRLILNIEAQNKYNPGYSLMKRAIYYGARLISSQYGTEFEGSSYQKIKKVYSIWICTDVPKNRKNTINHYRMTEHYMVGKAVEKPENYLTVVLKDSVDRGQCD